MLIKVQYRHLYLSCRRLQCWLLQSEGYQSPPTHYQLGLEVGGPLGEDPFLYQWLIDYVQGHSPRSSALSRPGVDIRVASCVWAWFWLTGPSSSIPSVWGVLSKSAQTRAHPHWRGTGTDRTLILDDNGAASSKKHNTIEFSMSLVNIQLSSMIKFKLNALKVRISFN